MSDPDARPSPLALGFWLAVLLFVGRALVLYAIDHLGRGHEEGVTLMRMVARAGELQLATATAGLVAVALLSHGRTWWSAPATVVLLVLTLSGLGWDDPAWIPEHATATGRQIWAAIVAAALAGALGLALGVRYAPGFARGWVALSLAVLALAVLPLATSAVAEHRGRLELRHVVADLTRDFTRLEVLESRAGAPPVGAVLSPTTNFQLAGGELPTLIMPPPCVVRFTVTADEGPVTLFARAGVDQGINRMLRNRDFPLTLQFSALVNGVPVFDARFEYAARSEDRARAWRPLGDGAGLDLEPGDVVTLRTAAEGSEHALAQGLPLGFGGCTLERRERVPRARSSPDAPNLVLIVMDTLRADHCSAYGHPRETTPALDRLAARGLRFERAYSTSSWTWPSTASLLTGLPAEAHGVRDSGACYLDHPLETLAEVLQRRGYTTAGFAGNPLIRADKNFAQGFEFFDDTERGFEYSAEVVPKVLDWLDGHAGVRFFLYLHLVDPHGPYDLIDSAREAFLTRPARGLPDNPLRYYSKVVDVGRAQGRPAAELVPAEHLTHMQQEYEAGIATGDHYLGQVLQRLEELGLAGETIVAFTSDHGEELLDHGLLKHGQSLHAELVHVPLVIAGPGLPQGEVVTTPVSNRHLAPTLARFGGSALAGVADALDLSAPRELVQLPIFSSTHTGWDATDGKRRAHLLGLRDGDWVLHLDASAEPRVLGLYDLQLDPLERRDVAGAEPERVSAMRAALLERARDLAAQAPAARGGGLWTLDMLRAAGYAGDDGEDEEQDR